MLRRVLYLTLSAASAFAQAQRYVGSESCKPCHESKFTSQSKTAHAHALAVAAPGSPGQWAFGAGDKATTWVSQKGEETIAEHGLSYYSSTKTRAITPGHDKPTDILYRTFDPIGTALRCFRCHSTGPVQLKAGFVVEPSEKGIHCEACHGPGSAHIAAGGGAAGILNPKTLNPTQINQLCGACHRQASELDDDTDWGNAWNLRHQPSYLHRAACFRNSEDKLSCLTCHNPHEPLVKTLSTYDAKCSGCHKSVTHKTAIAGKNCVTCHMPQVSTSPTLNFTNHWIGVYEQPGRKLQPSRRMVKTLRAAPVDEISLPASSIPNDPSTLVPVYEAALAAREKQFGPNAPQTAQSASDLGLFLIQTGAADRAVAPLQRALAIDKELGNAAVDVDRENLANALAAAGNKDDAIAFYKGAAAGRDMKAAARSSAALARLEPENAMVHLTNAVAAEEAASGKEDRKVALLLHELALAFRDKGDDPSAEPLLRRALAIQQKLAKPDYRLTTGIMNTLGNLLEGARRFDEAEKLERAALKMSEEKFGPESAELSMTCTNLADILWNKKDFVGAGQLYRRALLADTALYGPDRPETAADIANLGMVSKEAGQAAAAETLLRGALEIYEKTLGPESAQAKFVRDALAARP